MWFTRLRLWLLLALVSGVYCDVDPIVAKGSKLFYKTNGTQFFIKGLSYYSSIDSAVSYSSDYDYLAAGTACRRDIPVFQDLGVNTITVFSVDATQNHDDCMSLLQDAGIYVIPYLRELNTDGIYHSWTTEDFSAKTDIVDAFANYNNVLAFLVDGFSVTNYTGTATATLFKAAVRDVKAYIASKGYRRIPVGIEDRGFTDRAGHDTLDYFNCADMGDSVDIYGAYVFTWCGDATMESSGYDQYTDWIKNYSVPVFMSQYGCLSLPSFSSMAALYGPEMTPYWSGGVYYTYAGSNVGLVNASSQSVFKGDAYSSFSSQLASATPSPTNAALYSPTATILTCPEVTDTWQASPTLPPQPDADFCSCTLQQSYCQLRPGLNYTMLENITQVVCDEGDETWCEGMFINGTLGTYGPYSMCNSTTQFSLLMSNNTNLNSASGNEDCMLLGSDEYATKNPAYAPPTAQCAYQTLTPAPTTDTGSNNSVVTDTPDSNSGSHNGLSGGAIAGIVIGVIAGIAIIAVAAAVIFVRRRRATARAQEEKADIGKAAPGVPEMSAGGSYETPELCGGPSIPRGELHDTGLTEMPARLVLEMPAQVPSELPVDIKR